MEQILDDTLAVAGGPKFSNCYVKNFSADLDDQGLKELFEEFGEIKSACVMKDESGNSKGFGFVCFSNTDSAEAAVNAMNNKEINGQKLYVNRAQSKDERQKLLRQQYSQGTNLYVKNLDDTIDDARLKETFSKYGNITSAKVVLDQSGNSKGFGFVCFSTPEEAKKAIKLNGTFMGSKPLYVGLAQRLEERRATLLAENQQKQQYLQNVANIPIQTPDFLGQIPSNTPIPSYPTNTAMSPPLRWNRGMTRPQVGLGRPGVEAVPSLGPNLAPPYVSGAASMAMGQNQVTTQSNFIGSQFRGNVGAHNVIPNPIASLVAGPSNCQVGQQYRAQLSGIPGQMLGAIGPEIHETMSFMSANIMPKPMVLPNEQQDVSAAATGTNVQSSRQPHNMMTVNSQGPRTMASPVRAEQTLPAGEHAAASISAVGGAGEGGEGKCLNETERQSFGDKIYEKIAKGEPSLAGKLTGMIIQMDGSFVRKIAHSDAELEQAINDCKLILSKKERDQMKADEGDLSTNNNCV
ncbi:unnamed protein product [Hymenolepis diminuta]|uniref:Polyadenylate-binding protein n=1 Tax=Hymenolepis diminuta TaxID=6216 RepID=A0A0R3SE66_HYMDI|nr:unnamed protein product [Hymenolepis diminuta]VUZ57053.1 unnamed protein product [Hymenolepis diminuta]